MRELLILRHAKSSWSQPGLDDHDRPLNKRGLHDAPRIGALIAEKGLAPDTILTSTAVRARTTAALVSDVFEFSGTTHRIRELYLSSPGTIVGILSALGTDCSRAMVVAHNPGLEELVFDLTGRDEPFPTAALAAVRLPIDDWNELALGIRCECIGLWRPNEI